MNPCFLSSLSILAQVSSGSQAVVTIEAANVYGALHALESLMQLAEQQPSGKAVIRGCPWSIDGTLRLQVEKKNNGDCIKVLPHNHHLPALQMLLVSRTVPFSSTRRAIFSRLL